MGPNKKCLSCSNKNVLEIFEFWRLSDHRRQIRCNFSLRLSNYQLVSIYDKRFFVKILNSFFYQDKNNGAHEELDHISPEEILNEGRVEERRERSSNHNASLLTPKRKYLCLFHWAQSAQCSLLSSQLELQIIPIEQNRTLSAMSVAGTLGKMFTEILVVRCLVISLKSQMLNTNIKS